MSNVIPFPKRDDALDFTVVDALRYCVFHCRETNAIDVTAGAQLLNAIDTIELLMHSLEEEEE